MNNACPECGAIYAVAEKDIGRRIACKKCNSALVVAEEGLVREEATSEPRYDDDRGDRGREREREDDRGRRRRDRDDDDDRPRKARGPGAGEIMNKLKGLGDVPTWLYAVGLFFTVYGFFGPAIDHSKVSSRQGDIEYAIAEDKMDEFDVKRAPEKTPGEDSSEVKDRNKRKTANEKSVERLTIKKQYADANQKSAEWWNVMFKMIGFFLLAFGSIGYLNPEQSQLKRILGGVTILLILLQIVGGSAGLHLQMGGRGG